MCVCARTHVRVCVVYVHEYRCLDTRESALPGHGATHG